MTSPGETPLRSRPTPILLADDHPTFRLGLKQIVGSDDSFSIIGEAGDGEVALDLIREQSPEIAVVDWDMPGMNGLDLVKHVRSEQLPTQIIILTMHDTESLVTAAVDAGVSGFVLKDNAIEDILDGLRAVRDGRVFLSPAVSQHVIQRQARRAGLQQQHPALQSLTPSEHRILLLVAEAKTSKEIAAELSVSPRTVDTHRKNICDKLDLTGSHSLMQFAVQNRSLI